MDTVWLGAAALIFGVVLGAAITLMLVFSHHRGQAAAAVVAPSVPDGVEQVLDALESAGVVLDPSNNVLKASPGALSFGLVWHQALVHPPLLKLVDQVRRYGEPISEEVTIARGPFGEASIQLMVRVARLGTRYVLLLAEDRTEAHRLEEVRRDFVANISHELKTPIGAVGLLAEALETASGDPEQVRRFAKRLSRESERLARITQEIIELSRLQAKDPLEAARVVDLDEVIVAAIDRARVAADAERIRIIVGGASGARVFGDDVLLATAVENLVLNAVQHSPAGSRVGVGVTVRDDVVEVAVTDQGAGIPEDELERVFERFFRGDPSRSRRKGGSGLGLSIVKHVVQNHGGDIRVWSQLGNGSTFTIRLPLAAEAAVQPPEPPARPAAPETAPQQKAAAS